MSESRFNCFVMLLLTLVCAMAYVNTLEGEWVWDDVSSVLVHRHVQDPGRFFQLFREDQHAFGRGQGNFYRPMVAASFMLDYAFSGGPRPEEQVPRAIPDVSPFLFHITNMVWHLAAALLFLALLGCLGAPRFVRVAAPLIFVVHPLHTEAVAYISGRADMMSAALVLAALCASARALRAENFFPPLALACVCFIVALCSKESSLIYPVLLALVIPLMPSGEEHPGGAGRRRLWLLGASVVILVAYLGLRATVLRFAQGGDAMASPLLVRLYETVQALGAYGVMLFVPTGLHMERTLDTLPPFSAALGLLFLLVLVAGSIIAWRRGHPRITVGFAWFTAAWLPISGVFPLNAPLAEHWMYVPMIGFWWALMELLRLATRRPLAGRVAWALVLTLVVVFLLLTAQRNLDWRDNERLFNATLRMNPNSARVHYNLAVTYEALEGNYAGARRHYEAYLALRAKERARMDALHTPAMDDEIEARLSLGRVLIQLGAYTDAANTLAPLIQLSEFEGWRPTAALAALETGRAMLALGEFMQASVYLDQAMRIEPMYTPEIEALLAGHPLLDGY